MSHYFFHIRGGRQPDGGSVGLELSNLTEARRAAFVLAGTLLVDPDREYWTIPNWAIDIADGENRTLLTLAFHQGVAACASIKSMIGYYGVAGTSLPDVIGLAS